MAPGEVDKVNFVTLNLVTRFGGSGTASSRSTYSRPRSSAPTELLADMFVTKSRHVGNKVPVCLVEGLGGPSLAVLSDPG